MIKVDIVNEVSKIADITKVKAEVAVDAVFDAMRLSMQRGERIELRGSGYSRSSRASAASGAIRGPQGSPHPARPDHPLQARQRSPEYQLAESPACTIVPLPELAERAAAPRRLYVPAQVPGPPLAAPDAVRADTATTTLVGSRSYLAYLSDFGQQPSRGLPR